MIASVPLETTPAQLSVDRKATEPASLHSQICMVLSNLPAVFTGSPFNSYRPKTHSFKFRLPEVPYSFSGKLISLVWALELIAYTSKEVVCRVLELGPGGREVRLDSVPQPDLKRRGFSVTIR